MTSEHDEQKNVINWARMQECIHPELSLLFAVVNGASLSWHVDKRGKRFSPQASKLKAEGLRPGTPDLCLPVARKGYSCLLIEMKAGRNGPTQEQRKFLALLNRFGNLAVVCHGAQEAIDALEAYLS